MENFNKETLQSALNEEREAAERRAVMRELARVGTFPGTLDEFIATFSGTEEWKHIGALSMSDFVEAVAPTTEAKSPAPASTKKERRPDGRSNPLPKVPRVEVERRIREALGVRGREYTTEEVAQAVGLGPRQVRPVLIELVNGTNFLKRRGRNRDTVWLT